MPDSLSSGPCSTCGIESRRLQYGKCPNCLWARTWGGPDTDPEYLEPQNVADEVDDLRSGKNVLWWIAR